MENCCFMLFSAGFVFSLVKSSAVGKINIAFLEVEFSLFK